MIRGLMPAACRAEDRSGQRLSSSSSPVTASSMRLAQSAMTELAPTLASAADAVCAIEVPHAGTASTLNASHALRSRSIIMRSIFWQCSEACLEVTATLAQLQVLVDHHEHGGDQRGINDSGRGRR